MGFLDVLKGLAPKAAGILMGPAGGMAAEFIGEKLFGQSGKKVQDIVEYVQGGGQEAAEKIMAIEADMIKYMEKMGLDTFQLEVADRDSARQLAKVNMTPQVILSSAFVGGYFLMLVLMFTGVMAIPEQMRDIGNMLLGLLAREIPTVMAFWFGTTKSSSEKNETIKNWLDKR